MSRQLTLVLLAAFLWSFAASAAHAVLIAQDDFNYPDGTALGGQAGGTGWTSAWQPMTWNGAVYVAGPAGDWEIQNQEARSVPDGATEELDVHRRGYAIVGAVNALYVRYDYEVPPLGSGELSQNGGIFGGISIGFAGTLSPNDINVYSQENDLRPLVNIVQPFHLRGDLFNESSFGDTNNVLTHGQRYTIVARIDQVGPTDTRLTVWLDPASESDTPHLQRTEVVGGTFLAYNSGFLSLYRESHNVTAPIYDTVRLGTTFEDVLPPVPEPGTAWGFAAIGVAALRARRRAKGEARV